MAEHTQGAVHLTSLDLDLERFQQQIQSMEQSFAEVGTLAAETANKVKETFSFQKAEQSIQAFSESATQSLRSVENAGELTDEKIRNLLKGLDIEIDAKSIETLKKLAEEIDRLGRSYNKVQIQTKDGELFRAVVSSTDEAGRAIQNTFDLTKGLAENIKTQIVDKVNQGSKAFKEQAINVDELKLKLAALQKTSQALYDSMAGSNVQTSGMQELTRQTGEFVQKVNETAKALEDGSISAETSNNSYNNLFKTQSLLVRLYKELNVEQDTASKTNATNADSVYRLALQYADLAKTIEKSNVAGRDDMIKLAEAAKDSEELLKGLAQKLSAGGEGVEVKKITAEVDKLTSSLIQAKLQFSDAQREQKDFIESAKPIDQLAKKFLELSQNIKKSDVSDNSAMVIMAKQAERVSKELTQLAEDARNGKISINELLDAYEQYNKSLSEKRVSFAEFSNASKTQEELKKSAEEADALTRKYEGLNTQIERFITSLTKFGTSTPEMEELMRQAEQLKSDALSAANEILETGMASEQSSKQYDDLTVSLQKQRQEFEKQKQSAEIYKQSLDPIKKSAESAISSLKTLEKTAIFKTSKDQVAALRAKYEEFLNTLKNTNISVDEAEKELADLQSRFNELETTVKRGNGTLENWVNKITESAKWQIANSALNLIQQSFGQLTGTIIDTEDAIIELRRVLNDKSLVSSEMTQTLYDIAYEFGQTFENVQEVAVKFAQTGKSWEETVAATRATMLGLNTAELEVSTATEGLIAVMAQFNVQADDLEKVIDKINITADNFPVTSEKIVAALQRAGGTAKAFGMSLDETIGVITALSQATGRAGESIGTAMNSLITFSMKDSALDKFSEFLGQDVSSFGVLELWQALAEEIKNGNKSLATMMSTSEEFNDLMDEELATSIGLTEEFTKAQEEANKMTAEGKSVYSTVGTYRQNYFIALLNNIATATEAIQGMSGAVGYSMQENEIAMESFSKKWNQLIVSAKELAIQFGEAGFLDLMKLFVDSSSAVLQLTKSLGGLSTVLVNLSLIIVAIKKEKIKSKLTNLFPVIETLTGLTKIYEAALLDGATRMQAFGTAAGAMFSALGGWVTVAAVAITAISAIATAQKKAQEEAKRARDEQIALIDESTTSYKEVAAAHDEYQKSMQGNDVVEQKNARDKLLQSLGYEADDINYLIKLHGDEETAIRKLIEAKYEQMRLDAQASYDAITSAEKLAEVASNRVEVAQSDREYIQRLIEEGKDYGNVLDELDKKLEQSQLGLTLGTTNIDITPNIDFSNITAIEGEIKRLDTQLADLSGVMTVAEQKESALFQSTKKARDAYTLYIVEVQRLKKLLEDTTITQEEYDEKLREAQNDLEGSLPVLEGTNDALEDMGKTIDNLNKKVDSFQSSYKSLTDIISNYNETGKLTADQLQTIMGMEPEYIALLEIRNGQLAINEEKLNDLIVANDNYMVQLEAIRIAEYAENLIKQLSEQTTKDMTVAEIEAALATQALSGDLAKAAMAMLTGKDDGTLFKKTLENIATNAGIAGNQIKYLNGKVIGLTGSYANLNKMARLNAAMQTTDLERRPGETGSEYRDRVNSELRRLKKMQAENTGLEFYVPPSTTTTKGGSGGKSNTDRFKKEKDALNELLEVYEHSIFLIEKNEKDSAKAGTEIAAIYKKMQDEVAAAAADYRKKAGVADDEYTRSLSKKWWELQENIEEALHGIYESTVSSYERAISYLEKEYDRAENNFDYSYMGENLKKQLDYQKKIMAEAEKELERLAKLGKDVNSEEAEDVVNKWYEALESVRDISQKMQSAILDPYTDFIDLADKFDIWDYMDFTKVDYLRMELQEINNMLADGTMSLKEYNAQLKQISYAIFEAQKEQFEKQKSNVEKAKDDVIKAYKADVDSLKNQKEQIQDYYETVTDGYNAEIKSWEKRKEEVSEYYETLIENLNEVQQANERINSQVDYYNNRQKIITNLEQAQARSGVEWREKEMEYQQSLIDLDEEWNRTQKSWDIQDQTEMLNKLKEQTLADIDLSIQAIRDTITAAEQAKTAAIEAIEAEIKGIEDAITATEQKAEEEIALIDEQIKALSQTIAEAIKAGTADGVVNSKAEIDQALVDGTNAMLSFIDSTSQTFTQTSQETANQVYGIYNAEFVQPMYSEIDGIAQFMQTTIPTSATSAGTAALGEFRKTLVNPLKNELASLIAQTEKANKVFESAISPLSSTPRTSSTTSASGTATGIAWRKPGLTPFTETAANIFITNNNVGSSNESVATKNQQQLLQQLGLGR